MQKKYNNKSSKHWFFIFTFVYIVAIALGTFFCLFIYVGQFNDHKNYTIQREAEKASRELSDSFDNISVYLKLIAKSLVSDPKSLNNDNIAKVLQERIPDDIGDKEVLAFTIFDWIDKNRNYVANSVYGIFPRQSNLQHRTYLDKTDKTPWKVFHASPVIGIPSGQKVIPIGIGVTDESGMFYGTLATGIRINKLEEKLSQLLYHNSRSYSFIVLNEDLKPVLASMDFYKNTTEETFNTVLAMILEEEMSGVSVNHGFLQKKVNLGRGIKYVFFSKLENYPYYVLIGENVSQLRQEIVFGFLPYFIIVLLTTTVCFVIFYRYHSKMVEPVIDLNNELLEEGTIKNQDQQSFSEITSLRNFIKKKIDELKNSKNEISHLLSLNKNLEQRIQSDSEDISSNIKEKMNFIRTVSHEVRSPVQGVAAITKGLVEHWQELDDNKKQGLIKEVFKNSNKLFNLVNNLLDNTKMESGKMSYHFEKVNIKDLVEEITDEFSLHLEEKKAIKLDKKIDSDENFLCVGDSMKIVQVLRNLITNAIKFTEEGTIYITLDKIKEHGRNFIRIAISDQGIGVPDEDKNKIFDSFFQSSRSKNVAIGTGLGLTISKDIVDAHSGKIWVEDNKPQGSIFYVIIPEVIATTQSQLLVKKIKNILLIDDDESSTSSLSLMLYEFNFNIVSLQSGHDAMSYLNKNKNKVDLIFLDMILPDMDGIEILTFIKKDKELSKIPIILQSGISGKEELTASLELGAFATLLKPFDKKSLIKILDELKGENNGSKLS